MNNLQHELDEAFKAAFNVNPAGKDAEHLAILGPSPELADMFVLAPLGYDMEFLAYVAQFGTEKGVEHLIAKCFATGNYEHLDKLVPLRKPAACFTEREVTTLMNIFENGNVTYHGRTTTWDEMAACIRKHQPEGFEAKVDTMADEHRKNNGYLMTFAAKMGASAGKIAEIIAWCISEGHTRQAVEMAALRSDQPKLTPDEVMNLIGKCVSLTEYDGAIEAALLDQSGNQLERLITLLVRQGMERQAIEAAKHRKLPGLSYLEIESLLKSSIRNKDVSGALTVVVLRKESPRFTDEERASLLWKLQVAKPVTT